MKPLFYDLYIYEDFLRKWTRWFVVSYVLGKPKTTDFSRIQGVFSILELFNVEAWNKYLELFLNI